MTQTDVNEDQLYESIEQVNAQNINMNNNKENINNNMDPFNDLHNTNYNSSPH